MPRAPLIAWASLACAGCMDPLDPASFENYAARIELVGSMGSVLAADAWVFAQPAQSRLFTGSYNGHLVVYALDSPQTLGGVVSFAQTESITRAVRIVDDGGYALIGRASYNTTEGPEQRVGDVVGLSSSTAGQVVSALTLPEPRATRGEIMTAEKLAIVALEGPPGCALFDLTDLPQPPQFLGYHNDDVLTSILGGALQQRGDTFVGLMVAPDRVIPFTIDAQHTVTLGVPYRLRGDDSAAPDPETEAQGQAVLDGDIALVIDSGSEVFVLDITEVLQPRLLGRTVGIASPRGIQRIDERYAVVANWANGVALVDVGDPQRPTVLNLARGGASVGVSVAAPYVYSAGEFAVNIYRMFAASEF